MALSDAQLKVLIDLQRNEISEHYIYGSLSRRVKAPGNKRILARVSKDELGHYNIFKKYTNTEVKPDGFKVWWFTLISSIFGLTFGLKLMEKGEDSAQKNYEKAIKSVSESNRIISEEKRHESHLIEMIDEQSLRYIGSIVLGLNDALVEITSTISGITFTMQNSKLIAATGLIMGIAAALSMSASEYLSTKTGDEASGINNKKNPITALIYTGLSYISAVVLIVLPYLIFENVYIALGTMLATAVVVIYVFTFYLSVAKNMPFKQRFAEMAGVSLGVSVFTFFLGIAVRSLFGIEI